MSEWTNFLEAVEAGVTKLELPGEDTAFFRGHSDASWPLLPSLAREFQKGFAPNSEVIAYYEFISKGGALLPESANSWDILFLMQHYGLPTRLLDWSESFATALFFALGPYRRNPSEKHKDAAIWILDPYALNKSTAGAEAIFNPAIDFKENNYGKCFIEKAEPFPYLVVSLLPTQTAQRVAAQRGTFTLHANVDFKLEAVDRVQRFVLPAGAFEDASRFLRLIGTHEFSIFPDLDGLGRHLRSVVF